MHRHRRAIRNGTLIGLIVALILPASSAFAAAISLERTIRTTPFAGTSVSMRITRAARSCRWTTPFGSQTTTATPSTR